MSVDELTADAWWAVVGVDGPAPPPVEVRGRGRFLPSRFRVDEAAVAALSVALMAAAALDAARRGTAPALPVEVDAGHVATAVRSERYFRRGGESAGAGFAPLSRFWPAKDGWVRTHANYPWHRAALLRALEVGGDADAATVADALRGVDAEEAEARVFAEGGVTAAVRTIDEWRAHPQGSAVAAEPLVGHTAWPGSPPRDVAPGALPASGVRVLDLTRVIAGPVCTRFLAALGAEVLRVDAPGHPDMPAHAVADTLLGKRSALLDLDAPNGQAVLHELLAEADVVVCGYRPGALDRFGLGPGAIAERHPGVVAVYLAAWGHTGPWTTRRGFDSVVQAPTGIAAGEVDDDSGEPGALPCQLLDHGTGYLAAAAALDGLRRQVDGGGTHVRRLSLARTAGWLTDSSRLFVTNPPEERVREEKSERRWLVELDSASGPVTAVAPPGAIGGRALRWPSATSYGDDPPQWAR